MAVDKETKSREALVRAMAARQGLVLQKSRRRDPRALDFGGFWLIDRRGRPWLGGKHGESLETVQEVLTDGPQRYMRRSKDGSPLSLKRG